MGWQVPKRVLAFLARGVYGLMSPVVMEAIIAIPSTFLRVAGKVAFAVVGNIIAR